MTRDHWDAIMVGASTATVAVFLLWLCSLDILIGLLVIGALWAATGGLGDD